MEHKRTEQEILRDNLKFKSITTHDYSRERYLFSVKMHTGIELLKYYFANRNLPEFRGSNYSLCATFALPIIVNSAFIIFRPISFMRNISTLGVLFGSLFALHLNIKSGFHELAKQDNKHGRAVFFQRKFTFIG